MTTLEAAVAQFDADPCSPEVGNPWPGNRPLLDFILADFEAPSDVG